jgi:integrase
VARQDSNLRPSDYEQSGAKRCAQPPFATTLLEKRVHPAIASAVLGHSSTAFTMNTYQHVLDGMTQAAADAIDEALGGPPV